jgi:hypothetical protein
LLRHDPSKAGLQPPASAPGAAPTSAVPAPVSSGR